MHWTPKALYQYFTGVEADVVYYRKTILRIASLFDEHTTVH